MEPILLQLLLLLASSNSVDLDDPELLKQIRKGNHAAFKTFFDKHHSFLYHFLLKKGLSEQAAEDLVQQAFITIWEKRDQIDPKKSLRAYLFKIAYTRMLNLFRDHAKFKDSSVILEAVDEESPDEDIHNQELNQAIETAINEMPEKRQVVFRLCFIQEFTYKEAAEVLNVSVKTIENHMGLALKDMRSKLEKYR